MSVTQKHVDSAKAYVKNYKVLPAEERKQITEPFLQRLIDHGIIQDTNYYKNILTTSSLKIEKNSSQNTRMH